MKLRQFMQDRYGFDQYGILLVLLFFVLRTVVRMTRLMPFALLAYAVLAYAIYRVFSKKRDQRAMENARFLAMFQAVGRWFRFQRTVRADREHRYFKCPNCQQPLRVPRGKGKIQVSCRACGAQFEEKT